MGCSRFRVGGRIIRDARFAGSGLWQSMLLTPEEQATFCRGIARMCSCPSQVAGAGWRTTHIVHGQSQRGTAIAVALSDAVAAECSNADARLKRVHKSTNTLGASQFRASQRSMIPGSFGVRHLEPRIRNAQRSGFEVPDPEFSASRSASRFASASVRV